MSHDTLKGWYVQHVRRIHWWVGTVAITAALAVNLVASNLQAAMGFGLALALNWIIWGLLDAMNMGARVMGEQHQLIMQLMAEKTARELRDRVLDDPDL